MTEADLLWLEAWNKETAGIDLSTARTAGRATKANPNKEDAAWWNQQGPLWVQQYIQWRELNTGWKIWHTPQGVKAIELELNPTIAGVTVKMFIDRVFEVDGHLVIVDLKTSSKDPLTDLQLGFYRVGLKEVLGVDAKYGTYFMARKAGTTELVNLEKYTTEYIEYLVAGFDKARKSGIFLPNLSSCNICGLKQHCTFKKEN